MAGRWAALLACGLAMWPGMLRAGRGPALTPGEMASLMDLLHPDYLLYIGAIRYGSSRRHPATLYAGLVRRGGLDPTDPRDGPRAGHGVLNDLIVFADTYEWWRTPAWRLLLADHEYFHARHLAGGFPIPVVGFERPGADADYQEALAWNYVLQRARAGVYGALAPRERDEVAWRYRSHYEAFRRFVMRRQPSAWAHYGRFLPDPRLRRAASARTAGPARAAVPGIR